MWALELWDLKDDDNDESKKKFNDMVGIVDDDDVEGDDDTEIKKPEKPIFAMTADEISVYFGHLLKDLYRLDFGVNLQIIKKAVGLSIIS